MNKYQQLREAQQKRINDLPIIFAFNHAQFREGMAKLGLTVDDTDKIYSIGGGGYIRKEDSALFNATFNGVDEELKAAIEADTDGTGFIYDMFLYELQNHEYCITYDLEPTLYALGLTEDDVLNNPALLNGLKLARKEALKACRD